MKIATMTTEPTAKTAGSHPAVATPRSPGFDPLRKTLGERFLQALLFEAIAVTLCATLGSWLLGYPLVQMGALTVMISVIAMLWNMLFNSLFDRAQRRLGFRRGWGARAVQAMLFEIGLILAVVPLAAWWLDLTLWDAFVLDIGIALFFLPYTFIYNWVYDAARARLSGRRAPGCTV
ncbi:MAG: hypothetical protein JWQ88_538 [Rhodoferax sp.]|nr:hypothetical protein [Rhodoferax sp.]